MKKSSKTPTELQAQTVRIHALKADLDGLQASIKVETRAAEVARDGFDRLDPKNGVLLPELARHGVPPDRAEAFASWQRTRLAELTAVRKDIELSLADARQAWQDLHNNWRTTNAESLQVEAAQHVRDLGEKIIHRQQRQQTLRQKIAQINTARTQRDAAMAAHDAVVAAAIAQGTAAPEAPSLPELPAETVQQLEGAILLIGREVDGIKQDQQRSAAEARALQNIIDQRATKEFLDMIVTEAKNQRVSLSALRDELVKMVGQTVSAQVDADNAAFYRAEADRLRPEVERLRADVATLQNGIHKLTTSRSY
jgi:hypothetical protein